MPPTSFLFVWLRNKILFAVVVGTQTTRCTRELGLGWYEKQWFNSTRQIECVYLLPSLVVLHHLTKVILIGILPYFSLFGIYLSLLELVINMPTVVPPRLGEQPGGR